MLLTLVDATSSRSCGQADYILRVACSVLRSVRKNLCFLLQIGQRSSETTVARHDGCGHLYIGLTALEDNLLFIFRQYWRPPLVSDENLSSLLRFIFPSVFSGRLNHISTPVAYFVDVCILIRGAVELVICER